MGVQVNQTTAKASLTQMLNVVFQRMELGTETAHVPPIMVSDVLGLPSTDSSSMSAFVQSFLHDVGTPFSFSRSLSAFLCKVSCWHLVSRHPFLPCPALLTLLRCDAPRIGPVAFFLLQILENSPLPFFFP